MARQNEVTFYEIEEKDPSYTLKGRYIAFVGGNPTGYFVYGYEGWRKPVYEARAIVRRGEEFVSILKTYARDLQTMTKIIRKDMNGES